MNNWCEHIVWQNFGKTRGEVGGYWGMTVPGGFPQNICRGWIHCPICAAPRPEDQSPQEEKVYGNYPMTYPDIKLHQYVCLCIKEDNRTHLDSKCEIHGKKTEGEKMEDKVWCEHIMIGSIGNRDVYRFKTQPHGSTEMVPEKAMFCQYCSKPRPSEMRRGCYE